MIHVLGAGIAGISAAYHLKQLGLKSQVFEARGRWGGLCDNFTIDGYRFDHCVHLSFSKSDHVNELFRKSTDFHRLFPESSNYYNGQWLKHPAQNNLFPLPAREKAELIQSFVARKNVPDVKDIRNFDEWLRLQYGDLFAERFPLKYTKKYWTVPAEALGTSWVEGRFYRPTLEEVLMGAMTPDTPHTYYASEMRYPSKGGYKSFLNGMAKECSIILDKKVVQIDIKMGRIDFADGSESRFEKLISSLPLPVLIDCIKDSPDDVRRAADDLLWTSVSLVSLGFKRPDIAKHLWFYIYDEEFLPARGYSPNLKSADNVPDGGSSFQFEVYSSKRCKLKMNGDNLTQHVIEQGERMKLFEKQDVIVSDCRVMDYGNVVFDHKIDAAKRRIHGYLETLGISSIGRFGDWSYFWSDQSLLSGKMAAENIFKGM